MRKKIWIGMAISAVIVMVAVPIIIHVYAPNVNTEITSDGLLDYIGNCIMTIPTVILAVVAIWQTSKSHKIAEKANECALESTRITKQTIELSKLSISQTETANEISEKLLELEVNRQNLDLRPSFVVTKWRAPIKNFESIVKNPDCLSVQVGEYSNEVAWGIEMELLNISSGFESICFKEAYSKDGKKSWTFQMENMSTRKLELPSLEKAKIYFYADKSFWQNQVNESFIVEFFVRNRLDDPYNEKFELFIMDMTDEVIHKENELYLYLEIQNYSVEKIEDKSVKSLGRVAPKKRESNS